MIIQHLANLPSSCPADSSSLASCISALKDSISALESSVKATEGSSGNWETFGWLCAIAVGIGVAGEIVVIVAEHLDDLEDWRCGIIRPPDRPPSWRFWFDIIATLLVVAGVFGEAGATAEVASINSQLRSKTSELRGKSDRLLAVITEEAGDAVTSAKKAHDEAAAVTGIADEARQDAKDALLKAQAAQSSLAQAESDAAKAQLASANALGRADAAESHIADAVRQANKVSNEVAAANQQLEILRSLLSARHVSDTSPLLPLKSILKGVDLFVTSQNGDEEAREFCSQIGNALHDVAEMNFRGGCGAWGVVA